MSHAEFLHAHVLKAERFKPTDVVLKGSEYHKEQRGLYIGIVSILKDPVYIQNPFINHLMVDHEERIRDRSLFFKSHFGSAYALKVVREGRTHKQGVSISADFTDQLESNPLERMIDIVRVASFIRDEQKYGLSEGDRDVRADVLSAEVIAYFMDVYRAGTDMPIVLGNTAYATFIERYPSGVTSGIADKDIVIGDPLLFL